MESSVHREVQALFGGGTVETCHGDMVRHHFPTLQKSGTQRVRHGYNSVRPCHLWQRSKELVAGLTEPQRANVSPYVPCGKHGRHEAETG